VPMPHRRMPVRMAVRLRPFPALVLVLVMLVVNMEVLVVQGRMRVVQDGRVIGRPQDRRDGAGDQRDCGQDREGFKPAYGLRPRGSVQYALALGREDGSGDPLRFRFGFIGSSDSHTGRAATGYKPDVGREGRTDIVGPRNDFFLRLLTNPGEADDPLEPQPAAPDAGSPLTVERMGSFLYPGGTVAVHADTRDRDGAARFSFLLLIPVSIAAVAYTAFNDLILGDLPDGWIGPFVVGMIAAFGSGLFAIHFLLSIVRRHTFAGFAIYRIVAALIILGLIASGARSATF